MSIKIERRKGVQMIRMMSDTITESDADSVQAVVELALSGGLKNFILSIMEKMLADHAVLSGLLMNCEKLIRSESGTIMLVISPGNGGEGLFRRSDSRLGIPVFGSEDDAMREMLGSLSSSSGTAGS